MTDQNSRTELLLGSEGVKNLRDSFVIVAGAGAVGGYVIEALVRAGVGRIRVIDGDEVEESNLNRQILATHNTIGMSKAEVAKERALSINPNIIFESVHEFITSEKLSELISNNPDVVVDAIDTIEHKTALLAFTAENGIKTFSSMGAALRLDAQAIKIAPLKKTKVCPLASSVRSRLRDYDASNITCVYSDEEVKIKPTERNEFGKSTLGVIPTIPGIFGLTLANETIKYLVEKQSKE